MKKFSFRSIMIFVMCLVVAVLLIGLGIAGVIKFKHRDISCYGLRDPYHLAITLTWPQFLGDGVTECPAFRDDGGRHKASPCP